LNRRDAEDAEKNWDRAVSRDKYVIECWLKLYGRLNGTTYKVIDWPDKDSSKQAIDAICQNEHGRKIGIEHTLIQPFEGEKTDTARFAKTLAGLEAHPDLLQQGFLVEVSQPVGTIQTGIDWSQVQNEQLGQLRNILVTLAEGHHTVSMKGTNWSFEVGIHKMQLNPNDPGKVFMGRIWPGDPGPELIIKALEDKVPKLSKFVNGKRILLLEKDAIAGTIESQFKQLPNDSHIADLLSKVDELWATNTAGLQTEGVIFTNQVPHTRESTCSLNLRTGEFWRAQVV